MTGPAFSVFLPSYNKPWYVRDAIGSVLDQDCTDFELWVLENSDDDGETRTAVAPLLQDPRVIYEEITLSEEDRIPVRYPTAVLLNRYYPKASGEYIAYISDDDVFDPQCFSRCLAEFAAHPDYHAVWFTMWREQWDASQVRFRAAGSIPAVNAVGAGTGQPKADCRVDGGQVIHRRECVEEVGQPLFPEVMGTAHHADGVFLQKLADLHPLHPIPDRLLTHRCTPLSTWDRPGWRA